MPPGGIATLILPSDASWDDGGVVGTPLPVSVAPAVDPHAVKQAARVLREKKNVLLLLGGEAVHQRSQQLAWRIAAMTGAKLMTELSVARIERGQGRLPLERVPYPTDTALKALAPFDHLILVNAVPPVGFFAYPGKPSRHYQGRRRAARSQPLRAEPGSRAAGAGRRARRAGGRHSRQRPEAFHRDGQADAGRPRDLHRRRAAGGRGDRRRVGELRPRLFPQHPCRRAARLDADHGRRDRRRHSFSGRTAIGLRAKGANDRRVLALQADGSAMYTVQGLWTQAREKLPVTTIILSNRKYQILIGEFFAVGANPGPTAMNMLDLGNPDIGWVKLAQGLGVEAAQADTLEGCADLMAQSFKRPGPFLIELLI